MTGPGPEFEVRSPIDFDFLYFFFFSFLLSSRAPQFCFFLPVDLLFNLRGEREQESWVLATADDRMGCCEDRHLWGMMEAGPGWIDGCGGIRWRGLTMMMVVRFTAVGGWRRGSVFGLRSLRRARDWMHGWV